jgi:tRNA(adenine34) deaminase
MTHPDEHWMREALAQAAAAARDGEVPVGAVLVAGNTAVAGGRNRPIGAHDPSAHAEIDCLRAAGRAMGNYRLTGTTLYVTLEPCLMCVGAIVHARVTRVVFGAHDPKSGAVTSVCRGFELPGLNHRVTAEGGVLEAECAALLRAFFRARRT